MNNIYPTDYGFLNGESTLEDLSNRVGQMTTIHCFCSSCGSEDTKEDVEITSEMIDDLLTIGTMATSVDCDNCGSDIICLEDIVGIDKD